MPEIGHHCVNALVELFDAREQGPLPGAELSPMEAYQQIIKCKTFEEIHTVLDTEQDVEEGDFRMIDFDGLSARTGA